jgi:hypothetical protein
MKTAAEMAIDGLPDLSDVEKWIMKQSQSQSLLMSKMQQMGGMGHGDHGDHGMGHGDHGMGMGGNPFDALMEEDPLWLIRNGGLLDVLVRMDENGKLEQ